MHFTKLSWNVFFLFENYGEGQSKGLNFFNFFYTYCYLKSILLILCLIITCCYWISILNDIKMHTFLSAQNQNV